MKTPLHTPAGRVCVTLVLGSVALAAGAGALLSETAPRVAGANDVRATGLLAETTAGVTLCQGRELLYRGTGAIRVSLTAVDGPGPSVRLTAVGHGRELTAGSRSAGWTGTSVTIPVRFVRRTTADVRVCLTLGRGGRVTLHGGTAPRRSGASAQLGDRSVGGRAQLTYLRPGRESWWSYAGTVAHRVGLGRAWPGTWVALVAGALMLAAGALAGRQLVRDQMPGGAGAVAFLPRDSSPLRSVLGPLGRLPAAAWTCATVAFLSATVWLLITPPLQVSDEPAHVEYVQYLAETGRLPTAPEQKRYSAELGRTLALTRFEDLARREHAGLWSTVEQDRLERALAVDPSRASTGPGGSTLLEPPLYYALEAIPYRALRSRSLLERLTLMRLVSALLGAAAVLFVFLFLREALPGVPWAWTVGGLGMALQPVLGTMSGGVNPDSLLFLSSAALFYCLGRAFHRGLTSRLAAATGAVIAAGVLSKLAFAGLVPGALLALVVCAIRQAPRSRRLRALRLPAAAVGIALIPIGLMMVVNVAAFDRPPIAAATASRGYVPLSRGDNGNLPDLVGFTWQLFLPTPPGVTHHFAGRTTFRDFWLNGLVGATEWRIRHAEWVYSLAFVLACVTVALCGLGLADARGALEQRRGELASYLIVASGLILAIGSIYYRLFVDGSPIYAYSRYLLPLAALFAAVLVLAARGGGKRWGPVVGTLIVLIALAHDAGSQLLTISKWYA